MARFPSISSVAATAAVPVAAGRYSRPPEPIRLPSWVHTKEFEIWGYAA
jgi:hypothetical protein